MLPADLASQLQRLTTIADALRALSAQGVALSGTLTVAVAGQTLSWALSAPTHAPSSPVASKTRTKFAALGFEDDSIDFLLAPR